MGEVPKQLTPFAKKGDPRSDELRSRQKGSVGQQSEKQLAALRITGSMKAKCKNCNVDCFMKQILMKKDAGSLCIFPIARAAAVKDGTAIVDWDDNVLKGNMVNLMKAYQQFHIEEMDKLEVVQNDASSTPKEKEKAKKEAVKMMNTFFNRIEKFKSLYEPPVEKKININVTTNLDKMAERILDFKKEQAEIVVEVEDGN